MPVEFLRATTPEHYRSATILFMEYAQWLGIDLSFQQFEEEIKEIGIQYGPPSGGIILCKEENSFTGCAGVRMLHDDEAELKRMYLRPEWQGKGIGKQLLDHSLELARELGYKSIRLDTLDTLKAALKLYRANGFKETPPYYNNPISGVVYMQKFL